jgi:predicted SAM-dependent methyltransferase
MNETSKSHDLRIQKDHYNKYLFGEGIDIGAGSDPLKIINGSVLPYDVQSGDANLLSNINDDMFDFVYASHCLEHMKNIRTALFNWCRVLKPGGYLYITVPDFALYEKYIWPSRFNPDHKFNFSLDISRNEYDRSNFYNISDDLSPILLKNNVEIIETDLQTNNYNDTLGDDVDQTLQNALIQINIIGKKNGTNS